MRMKRWIGSNSGVKRKWMGR